MPTEQQILTLIRKMTPDSKKYLYDDAAVTNNDLIFTTDTLVENTHFTLNTYSASEIGWKALAVNLSDIAAMGGKPLYALVSLSLPRKIQLNWIKHFYKGLLACAKKYNTQIIGGNLTRSKEINVTVTILGKTISKKIGKRSNARAGDLVFATGAFGNPVKKPIPQIKSGQKIVTLTKRVALMDASDGLADCLIQISNESKVKIVVFEDKIPVPKEILSRGLPWQALALYGGEDYELVGTASKNDVKKLLKTKKIKIIGEVQNGSGAFLRKTSGRVVKLDMKKVFKHFI